MATEDDIDPQARWRRVRAKVVASRGTYGEAETLAREAVAMLDGTDYLNDHADALVDLAEVLRLAGRPSEAAPITQAALALYERKGNEVSAELARTTLACAGPELSRRMG